MESQKHPTIKFLRSSAEDIISGRRTIEPRPRSLNWIQRIEKAKIVDLTLDDLLEKDFYSKSVVIRCISTQDHQGKTLDELADIVLKTGTDKYDATRKGIGYHVGLDQGRHIDFFGTPAKITDHTDIFTQELLDDFYHGAQGDRSYHLRIDLVMIYDPAKLTLVEHLYGDDVEESDGFVFKDPGHKVDALPGIIKVLS